MILLCTVAIFVLLFTSAMISGSEIAFFSLSESFLDGNDIPSKKDRKIKILLVTPQKLLGTILIINTFVNILTVILFAVISEKVFGFFAPSFRFFLEVVVISFFILIFGEVLPKIYAERNALRFARKTVTVIFYLQKRLQSIIAFLNFFTRLIEKRIPLEKRTHHRKKMEVKKIMRPISDVVGVDWSDDFETVLQTVRTYGFSYYPVFSGGNIRGYVKAVDLLPHHANKHFDWHEQMTAFFTVSVTDTLQKIYTDFKLGNSKFAVVLNANGKQVGFVTKSVVFKTLLARYIQKK